MPYLTAARRPPGIAGLAVLLLFLLTLPAALAQGAEPITGTFSDGFLTINISGGNGQYSGQFEAGGRTYPFTASGTPQRIAGTYQDAGQAWQFSAELQGDRLTFSNTAQTFQLQRVAAAAPAATGGYLPAGTRLTYRHMVSSTPGTAAGPDARGSGGHGFIEVDIIHSDATACVSTMTMYSQGLTMATLTVSTSQTTVSDGSSCSGQWMHPASLASYQAAPGGIETVERGPFELGGRTYNALTISTVYQNQRSWTVYDLDTGILLAFTEGSGDRSNPDGSSSGAASSGFQELISVRQMNLPWTGYSTLPSGIASLQSLSYRGQMVQSTPGITMFDTSVTTGVEMTYAVQQRGPAWLQLQSTTALSMLGSTLPPSVGTQVAAVGTGLFLPPQLITQLQAGQLLDTDPVTGYRLSVANRDQGSVTLSSEGPGYRSLVTFDAGSGLLRESYIEVNEEGMLRTVTMELAGWN